MNKIGLILLSLVILGIFAVSGARAMSLDTNALKSIDVATLQKRLDGPNPPFVLDVRELAEFQAGHLKGATLIPLGTLPDHLGDVPKNKPVVVMCRSGNRSARAATFLIEQGYTNVENLSGGMMAWDAK